MLLTRWKFPDVISSPIALHHQIEAPEGTNGRDVAMLRVANTLPQELALGQDGNPVPPAITIISDIVSRWCYESIGNAPDFAHTVSAAYLSIVSLRSSRSLSHSCTYFIGVVWPHVHHHRRGEGRLLLEGKVLGYPRQRRLKFY